MKQDFISLRLHRKNLDYSLVFILVQAGRPTGQHRKLDQSSRPSRAIKTPSYLMFGNRKRERTVPRPVNTKSTNDEAVCASVTINGTET